MAYRDLLVNINELTKKQKANSYLDELYSMLVYKKTFIAKDIIDFIEKNNIDINSYFIDKNDKVTLIPLIYVCCQKDFTKEANEPFKLFTYLLKRKVQLDSNPIVSPNPDKIIELLFYCNVNYIPYLKKAGCTITTDMNVLYKRLYLLILNGNFKKIYYLIEAGALQKDILQNFVQTIIEEDKKNTVKPYAFRILDNFFNKLQMNCTLYPRIFPELYESNVKEIIFNYQNTFKLLFSYGITINDMYEGTTLFQHMLNTYVPDFIIECTKYSKPNLNKADLVHYSNFDQNTKIVMRYFYNEENYKVLCDFLNGLKVKPIKKRMKIKQKIKLN